MKLGFNQATCMKKSSVETDLELCEKHGYDYIELRLDMLKKYFESHTIDELKQFFSKSNIKPFALNSIEDINFTTEDQWKKLVELFTFACEIAKEIGNPYIIVVPTMSENMKNKNEQEVFDDSVLVLSKLSDIARGYGVKISFEPIGDIRWCCRSLRQAYEIVKAVDRDDVGLTIDCINFYMNDKCADIEYLNSIPLEKIFVFHINDCEDLPLKVLDHSNRLFPGDGIIPIGRIVEILKNKGYNQIASLELFRPEYWDMPVETVIKIGADKSKSFIQ